MVPPSTPPKIAHPPLAVPSHHRSCSSLQTTRGLQRCSLRPPRCMQAGRCTTLPYRCLTWATLLSWRGSAPSPSVTPAGRMRRPSCNRATAALPGGHGSRPLPLAPERSRSGLGSCHGLRSLPCLASGRSKDGTFFMRSTHRRTAAARRRVSSGPGTHDRWHQLRLPARQHGRRRDKRRVDVHVVHGWHRLNRRGRLMQTMRGGSVLGGGRRAVFPLRARQV